MQNVDKEGYKWNFSHEHIGFLKAYKLGLLGLAISEFRFFI
jgi:hypothetical protein